MGGIFLARIPVAFLIGWSLGRVWRVGLIRMGFWLTEYVIMCVLSVYLITQSGEAVISRLIILSVPALICWRRAWKGQGFKPPAAPAMHAIPAMHA